MSGPTPRDYDVTGLGCSSVMGMVLMCSQRAVKGSSQKLSTSSKPLLRATKTPRDNLSWAQPQMCARAAHLYSVSPTPQATQTQNPSWRVCPQWEQPASLSADASKKEYSLKKSCSVEISMRIYVFTHVERRSINYSLSQNYSLCPFSVPHMVRRRSRLKSWQEWKKLVGQKGDVLDNRLSTCPGLRHS